MPFFLIVSLACGGSPTVTVETGAHPDAPAPGALAEVLERQIQRPIQACYQTALESDAELQGSVSYAVLGSHGILKSEISTGGPEALEACALKPMANQRLLRTLGDGDHTVGFTLTVRFSKG